MDERAIHNTRCCKCVPTIPDSNACMSGDFTNLSLPLTDNVQESVIPYDMYHLVSIPTPSSCNNT